MENKVILISIDGMRADGVQVCGNPFVDELKKIGSYTFGARTVFPSVTLPCHMSMFHSVAPERHGTTTNIYMPQVRPINGLFEQIKASGKNSLMYYGWEPLRDISRPDSLLAAEYIDAHNLKQTDEFLTERALCNIEKLAPDFVFLYLAETDVNGHANGWMSRTYLDCISAAIDDVKRVIEETKGAYTLIVTADHGGHDRVHGTEMDEDMVIPMFFVGKEFEPGKELENVSLLDLAPTIADIMQVNPAKEWEGKSLLRKTVQ